VQGAGRGKVGNDEHETERWSRGRVRVRRRRRRMKFHHLCLSAKKYSVHFIQ
jgi:hypothetical protein